MDAAHIMSRRFRRTRHLPENGLCLCTKCHRWFHEHLTEWQEWIVQEIGQDKWDLLYNLSHKTKGVGGMK